jgi:DNA-binding transcriptional LysR family regulator
MFDWQDLKHFVVLARTGSLSAAAREMGCDHATVGRRVAALEKALGLRLILRLPRSTPLTQDGKMIAGLAAEIENQSHAIVRHARSAGETPQTQVRISAPPSIAARVIAPEIAKFLSGFSAYYVDTLRRIGHRRTGPWRCRSGGADGTSATTRICWFSASA